MTEEIGFNDWEKLDLRVGRIIKVEEIEGADKLYKLEVDLGKKLGKRILVAGIKKYYKKEELEGKRCVVLANLEAKKLKGIESKGMILATVNKDPENQKFSGSFKTKGFKDESKIILIQPEKEIELGSRIR